MKKFILTIMFLAFGLITFAQSYGVCYTVDAVTSKTAFGIGKYNDIYVTSTKAKYHCLKDVPGGTLISTAIADATMLYPIGYSTCAASTIGTLTNTTGNITTANITTANITTSNVTTENIATTLTLPGGKTITKTSGNGNSVTTSGSVVVGNGNDTLSTYKIIATGVSTLPLVITDTATVLNVATSGSLLADTAHFGTVSSGARDKYIRKKIKGVRATDVFAVTAINATNTALTGVEAIGYYATTDSLIISRSAATTAGMAVSYIRIKK